MRKEHGCKLVTPERLEHYVQLTIFALEEEGDTDFLLAELKPYDPDIKTITIYMTDHINACPQCRTYYEEMFSRYRKAAAKPLFKPEELSAAVFRRIDEDSDGEEGEKEEE